MSTKTLFIVDIKKVVYAKLTLWGSAEGQFDDLLLNRFSMVFCLFNI